MLRGPPVLRRHASSERAGHTTDIPMRGPLAVLTVPGAVDGWRLAHERHGRLAWDELFADAIHLARGGMAVSASLGRWLPEDAAMLREDRGASSIFLPGGKVLREGDRLVNPEHADSFEVLAREGARDGSTRGNLRRSCVPAFPSHRWSQTISPASPRPGSTRYGALTAG